MDRRVVAVGCGVVAFAGVRLLQTPGLLGSPGAEVYGHVWVQWWQSEAWPRLAPSTTWLADGPMRFPVIDPLPTWLAAGIGHFAGAVLAWDILALAGVALAYAGGAALALAIDGDPTTGGLVLALGPIVAGSFASGLSEDFAVGFLALAVAAVATGRRSAGPWLGLLPWCGLYLALLGGLGAVCWFEPRRWRTWAVAMAVMVAATVPVVWMQGDRLTGTDHRRGMLVTGYEPHWRTNPWHGADLASFVVPGPDPVHDGALLRLHPAYLGWTVLVLAALAGRRGGRWWAVLGLAVVLAIGPEVRVAGIGTGLPNPVVALALRLPIVHLVNHWGRLLLLGQVALAALASLGARRAPRWAPWVAAFEYAVLSPAPWPLPVADGHIPAIERSLDGLPDGSVLVVPSEGPGVAFQRVLYRQSGYRRRVFASPNRPGYGSLERVPLVRWFDALPGGAPPTRENASELATRGVAVLIVEDPYVAAVTEALGPPTRTAEGGAAWAIGP